MPAIERDPRVTNDWLAKQNYWAGNIRRVAEVGKLMVDACLIVIASFISPIKSGRDLARELFEEDEFMEVFIDALIETCQCRAPKSLYLRARNGKIPNFTGISSPYAAPGELEDPSSDRVTHPENATDTVIVELKRHGQL